MMRRAAPVALLAAIATTPAAAQTAHDVAYDQSIGAGAHWALPFSGHGEKPGIQLSWRRWFSPHLGVGTDFRWGSRRTTETFNAAIEQHERTSSYAISVGVLARGVMGRVSFIAGAGPGFFAVRHTSETRIGGLRDSGRSALRSFGVHMLLELEVRATRRLSAFAGLRSELRDVRDPESSSGYPVAGIRFAF